MSAKYVLLLCDLSFHLTIFGKRSHFSLVSLHLLFFSFRVGAFYIALQKFSLIPRSQRKFSISVFLCEWGGDGHTGQDNSPLCGAASHTAGHLASLDPGDRMPLASFPSS